VIVVRDNPKGAHGILTCVEQAIAAGRRAALACASRRGVALERDPAVVAAARLRSPRVVTVDLSAVYCGPRRCYPVIGGALVYKDRHHLTQVFSRTLAPILGRRIAAAMSGAAAIRGRSAVDLRDGVPDRDHRGEGDGDERRGEEAG
jgi:hypothetical protein